MGKTATEELEKAHAEIDTAVETQDKSRLAKSLDALRARFGFGQSAEDLTKANSTLTPGNDGYPNSDVNEGNISRARGKSKPAKHPDGNYEGLEEGENDTTDYENSESDELGGFKGKKVTEKGGKKSQQGVDEESFYKAIIDGDESGEVVEAINASDALELLATSMGKSIGQVSLQYEALGVYTTEQFVELNKSMSVLAEAIGTILETLEKSNEASAKIVAEAKTEAAVEETAKTGEEETTEKSMSADEHKYSKTLEFLTNMDEMNSPTFFSQLTGQTLLKKSEGDGYDNSPEALNTMAGRSRVKAAIMTLIKSEGLDPDYLGMLDYKPTSDVVKALPKQLRSKVGLLD